LDGWIHLVSSRVFGNSRRFDSHKVLQSPGKPKNNKQVGRDIQAPTTIFGKSPVSLATK
jgi:hypothetical protein